jgi:asparagine synthase (glutamine-hydrolysing)
MCGIAGILKVHPVGTPPPAPEVAIPEAWLDVLDDSIKHRGPDGQGRFRDRVTRPDGSVVDVAFVHRRLSIIDHAGGRQPMVSERGPWPEKPRNGRVAVVFNGCIYNHRELRRELQSAGHRFVSDHSDTEVLIHGWREWGHELFAKLDGMFAVAIWDASSGAIVLTRDRFGEKPLYETDHGTMYVFASCVPGLVRIRHMSVPRSSPFSHAAQFDCVARWMRFGWDTELPVARIIATPPGFVHRNATDVVVCETGVMNDWGTRLQFDGRRESIRVMEVDALLSAAVRSRLDADASVGVFLSGGIDSALVAAFARDDSRSVDAFTVRMPIAQFDESEAAAQTARHLGVRHHVLACDANPATDLVQTVTQLGLPFGDSSLLPSVWVSRAARSAVKVAIGGDGGDELFLGYERHRIAGIFSRLKRVPSRLLRFGARLFGGLDVEFNRRRRVARFFDAAAHDGYVDLLSIFPRSLYEQVTGYDAQKSASRHRSGRALRGHCEDPELAANEAYEVDLQGYLPEDILRKTDTASMAVGLEVRAPFLARELVDRMIRVRPDVLMPDGERKGLLKQVARKYLPDSIVDRPKMGFSIPIGEWFRTDYGGMKQLLLDTLGGPDPFPEDLLGITINRRFVATMVEDHMSRRRDHSQRLYMLLVLAIWAEWLRGVQRGS